MTAQPRFNQLPRFKVEHGQGDERYRFGRAQHCFWCGVRVRYDGNPGTPDKATREHLLPRSQGGAWGVDGRNVVVACLRCNRERKTDIDWVPFHIIEKHPRIFPTKGERWRKCPRCGGGAYCQPCGNLGVVLVEAL